jgi:hypothetical protein
MNCLLILILSFILPATIAQSVSKSNSSIKYLGFQVFTQTKHTFLPISPENESDGIPSKADLLSVARDLVEQIGATSGSGGARRIAVVYGPLDFDQTDAELTQLINDVFDVGKTLNVSIGFHLDESILWSRHSLYQNKSNHERTDWDAAAFATGRSLFWSEKPLRAPPMLCLNSVPVREEVVRRGRMIGALLAAGAKHADLAAFIVGWEAQIGQDFDTGKTVGYCALQNAGFKPTQARAELDAARERIVHEHLTLWASALIEGGAPRDRLYSHIAIQTTVQYADRPSEASGKSLLEFSWFTVASTAVNDTYFNPGYSTYIAPNLTVDILAAAGSRPWGSCEGANVGTGMGGASGQSMENYLAGLYNSGANFVNLFGFGVGLPGMASPFKDAIIGAEPIAAYKKFLNGNDLMPAPPPPPDVAPFFAIFVPIVAILVAIAITVYCIIRRNRQKRLKNQNA